MRFLVDENLPAEATHVLRAAGHDAETVPDRGLSGADDESVAQICRQEGLVLLTLDTDFADMQRYPPRDFGGVVVLRLARQDKPHVLAVLSALAPKLVEEDLAGRLWVVDEDRIRIR